MDGVGVVLDGPHLAGEVGGTDDVDAGEGEQQHVGSRASRLAISRSRAWISRVLRAVVVQGQGDAAVLVGGDVAGGGLCGPVEDGLDGALLEADAGLREELTRVVSPAARGRAGREVAQQVPGEALSQSLSKQAA